MGECDRDCGAGAVDGVVVYRSIDKVVLRSLAIEAHACSGW